MLQKSISGKQNVLLREKETAVWLETKSNTTSFFVADVNFGLHSQCARKFYK